MRPELVARALDLARVLAVLMPDEPEALGLLALLLLTDARAATRTDARAASCCWPTKTARAGTARRSRRAWTCSPEPAGWPVPDVRPADTSCRPASRRPRRVTRLGRHRLGRDGRPLRPPARGLAQPGRGCQPRGRGGDGRRPPGWAVGVGRHRRRPRARRLPLRAGRPSRPAAADWSERTRPRRSTRGRSRPRRTTRSGPSCAGGSTRRSEPISPEAPAGQSCRR